jgi:hypothetical protein
MKKQAGNLFASIVRLFTDRPIGLVALVFLLSVIFSTGLFLTVWSFFKTAVALDVISLKICFENDCVKRFMSNFDQSIIIAKGTLDFLVAIATAGGIVVALLSYLSSANTAALSNHIAHFSIFQEYVVNEVLKRNRVSPTSVDILRLYNLIFSTSRRGKTDMSFNYIIFVKKLIGIIKESNDKAQHAKDGSFRYKQHQVDIRDHLKTAGILVFLSPRNEFFEMEEQVFSLIDGINQSFCYSTTVPPLPVKSYN